MVCCEVEKSKLQNIISFLLPKKRSWREGRLKDVFSERGHFWERDKSYD